MVEEASGVPVVRLLLTALLLLSLHHPITHAATSNFEWEKALAVSCTQPCYNGLCIGGQCSCTVGWKGPQCDLCHGRVLLSDNDTIIQDGPINYTPLSNCAWVIDDDNTTSLTLRVEKFKTECGWDYLYVYDGDGTSGQQLAALCGDIDGAFEIPIKSEKGFVFFISDAAQAQDGFNIIVDRNRCAYNCTERGTCKSNACSCNDGFVGEFCERAVCTPSLEGKSGPCLHQGTCEDGSCKCTAQYHGDYCEAEKSKGLWQLDEPVGSVSVKPPGRASHASVLLNSTIWTTGGDRFNNVPNFAELASYNLMTKQWTSVAVSGASPAWRYDHTLVAYKNSLYMFGGVVERNATTSELWRFDTSTSKWTMVNEDNRDYTIAPIAVAGHSAHVIDGKMYIFFGYSPTVRFAFHVQIYDFDEDTWSLPEANDHIVGRYRHSSVHQHTVTSTGYVFVYGGITESLSRSDSQPNVTDTLMKYTVETNRWNQLERSEKAMFMHAAALMNGLMIVTGGNAHAKNQNSDECYNGDMMTYDIECNQWIKSPNNASVFSLLRRYGHTMVSDEENLYVVGGYNGTMLSDVLKYIPGECSSASRPEQCRSLSDGVRCVFSSSKCVKYEPAKSYPPDFISIVKNEQPKTGVTCSDESNAQQLAVCEELRDCLSCSSQSGCGWCVGGNQCLPSEAECVDGQDMIRAYTKCQTEAIATMKPRPCYMAGKCAPCKLLKHCNWFGFDSRATCISHAEQEQIQSEALAREAERLSSAPIPIRINHHNLGTALPVGQNISHCPTLCSQHNSCHDCVGNQCMWCGSMKKCVDMDSYLISFPYGQCLQWTTNWGPNQTQLCDAESADCSLHKTCSDCQLDPNCGWLDDGQETGQGTCMEGSMKQPTALPTNFNTNLWYFVGCPQCQCNGHSNCVNSTKGILQTLVCDSCQNHTVGAHCERCEHGFYGDPRNGGACKPCDCIGHADGCHPETGVCNCITKGAMGDKCEKCDTKYRGDPANGVPCAYDLTIDFIFTFKIRADAPEKYVSEMYLYSIPYKRDTDVQFMISCEEQGGSGSGAVVSLNLTNTNIIDGRGNQRMKIVDQECTAKQLKRYYLANDPGYVFGPEANTTFVVKVSNFTTPITIQVSFAQSPPINWVLFFVIFAACFIILLVLAGLLWMVKLRIQAYQANATRIAEIVHMASRPLHTVTFDLTPPVPGVPQLPTPIAIEPRHNYRAGVFTVAVRLPTGGRAATPNSASGMAVASALCYLSPAHEQALKAEDDTETRQNRKTNLSRFLPFLRSSNSEE